MIPLKLQIFSSPGQLPLFPGRLYLSRKALQCTGFLRSEYLIGCVLASKIGRFAVSKFRWSYQADTVLVLQVMVVISPPTINNEECIRIKRLQVYIQAHILISQGLYFANVFFTSSVVILSFFFVFFLSLANLHHMLFWDFTVLGIYYIIIMVGGSPGEKEISIATLEK